VAERSEPLMHRFAPGVLVMALLAMIVGAAFFGLLRESTGLEPGLLWDDIYLRRVVVFTLWQAFLSTLLSLGLALPVARALARRQRFPGRSLLLRLLGLPLVVPTIVAVFGIVAIYGQTGLMNRLAAGLGFEPVQYLYGLGGILIAHVFFNLPLAVRLLLPAWQSVPGESWRLAAQLGMSSRDILCLVEWPMLRPLLPQVATLVFMLCFTSFAVVLTLGGGPASTTIEVAIYQALRFDFDLGRATLLALLQLICCATLVAAVQAMGKHHLVNPTEGRVQPRPDLDHVPGRLFDFACIGLVLVSTLLPLGAVVTSGLVGPLAQVLADPQLWNSAALSLGIALTSSALAVLAGVGILITSRELRINRRRTGLAEATELCGSLILVIPPLVLGTGFFIVLRPLVNVFTWSPLLIVVVNALMGLPYVMRVLGPPMTRVTQQHERLCASLDIRGWDRLRMVEWPLLRQPAGLSLALCAALSTGDLGVVALFGSQDVTTLPLLLYQRLAGYQMGEAAVTALFLLTLSLLLFGGIERLIGGRAHD